MTITETITKIAKEPELLQITVIRVGHCEYTITEMPEVSYSAVAPIRTRTPWVWKCNQDTEIREPVDALRDADHLIRHHAAALVYDRRKQEHLTKHVKLVPDCLFCAQDKAANMAAIEADEPKFHDWQYDGEDMAPECFCVECEGRIHLTIEEAKESGDIVCLQCQPMWEAKQTIKQQAAEIEQLRQDNTDKPAGFMRPCDLCGGTGIIPSREPNPTCPQCDGHGFPVDDQPEPLALADNAINAQTEEIARLTKELDQAQAEVAERNMLIFRMQEAEKHNGWPNYETWCVNLWLTNEQGSYNWLHEIISENRQSVYDAAMEIREFVEGQNPLADQANMYTDMLAAALREVDWLRIIEANTDEEETE